jgi:hypothetical protein
MAKIRIHLNCSEIPAGITGALSKAPSEGIRKEFESDTEASALREKVLSLEHDNAALRGEIALLRRSLGQENNILPPSKALNPHLPD